MTTVSSNELATRLNGITMNAVAWSLREVNDLSNEVLNSNMSNAFKINELKQIISHGKDISNGLMEIHCVHREVVGGR